MTDVILKNCNLSNAILTSANIHRVVFKNCKLLKLFWQNLA
ncbi:pentapeptide repeat-containing protein [Bacillus safensis]